MCISTVQAHAKRGPKCRLRHLLDFFASNSSCDMSICISTVHAGTKRKLKCWSTAFYLRILTSHRSCDMSMSALRGFQALGLRPAFSL